MVSDFIYFWIFGVFEPKGQMGFNFEIFPKFEVFTLFCVLPCFLEFLGTMWFVDLDDPFGYSSDHFCTLCCFGMCDASVLSILFRLRDFLLCVLIQSLCYDLRDGGVPHTSMCMYIVG